MLQFNGVLLRLIQTQLPFPKTLSRRLTNPKGKRKDKRKGKRKGNPKGKRKGKHRGKSIWVSFRRNLKSIQVPFRLNFNCQLTNPKGKGKGKGKAKSIRVSFRRNLNLPQWLAHRKHLS